MIHSWQMEWIPVQNTQAGSQKREQISELPGCGMLGTKGAPPPPPILPLVFRNYLESNTLSSHRSKEDQKNGGECCQGKVRVNVRRRLSFPH